MSRSADILSLAGEAAVIARYGKIRFANAAAQNILGGSCVGKATKAVFGPEFAAAQAGSFIAGLRIGGKNYIVRMARVDEEQLIFLSCPDPGLALLNDSFICFIRNTLMNMNISVSKIRDRAEKAGDTDTLESAAVLTRNYYRLRRLIGNASMVMELTRDQLPISCTELNLSQLCRSYIQTASFFLPDIQFGGDLGRDLCCPGDATLVGLLLTNLLSNCLLHAKGCTRINVNLTDAGEGVLLAVSDNGCGIESEQLHTVFDRYKYGYDLSSPNVGVGLGLTVAQHVAQLHGGTLLLESRPGSGTSVRASFYRRSAMADRLRAPSCDTPDYLHLTLVGLADCLPASCFSEHYMD